MEKDRRGSAFVSPTTKSPALDFWLAPGKGLHHPGSEWAVNDKKIERGRERESEWGGGDNTIVPTLLPPSQLKLLW